MKKIKLLGILSVIILSFSLIACSKTDEVVEGENTTSKLKKEHNLFDEDVIIVDNDDVKLSISGKERIKQGDSVGYLYEIINKGDKKVEVYAKGVTLDGMKKETSLNEELKVTVEPDVGFSTQMTFEGVKSLDELKNAQGVFCVKIGNETKEYKFELE